MPYGAWPHGLETGVREIDAANEGLHFLIDRVFSPGVECRGRHADAQGIVLCDRADCTRIDAILRYVRRNFDSQERMMVHMGYPERERHLRDHRDLLNRLAELQGERICAEEDRALVRVVVARWALRHVNRHDRSLARWAITRRQADPAAIRMPV